MRVNMDSSINDEPRFKLLAKKLGIPFLHGVGCCWAVWLACYHARSERLRKDEANACADNDQFADAMISVGLAHEVDDDSIIVHGVTSRIAFLKKQQERGSTGGRSKRKSATGKEVTTPSERLANASADRKRSLKSETATAQANTLALALAPASSSSPSEKKSARGDPKPATDEPETKVETPSPHHRFIAAFTQLWNANHPGSTYPFAGGKDGAHASQIVKAIGDDPEKWADVLARYFEDHSDFFRGHSLAKLASQLPRFLAQPQPQPKGTGHAAASQWNGRFQE